MITDIPTAEDFYTSGKELLDFAWDIVAGLLGELDLMKSYGTIEQNESDAYWKSAQRKLSTALSITQQGVEFILKGKIADISVFILIAGEPVKWPSPYTSDDIKFSQFRMIDAQDLIKVHDTFSQTPLPRNFSESFSELRETRNSIMHSIDKSLEIPVIRVVNSILFMHKCLFPNETWGQVRKQFILKSPSSEIGGIDHAINEVCYEIALVFELLQPAKLKEYFNIEDHRQHRYFCPECYVEASHDSGFDSRLAVLKPKGKDTTNLYCPVCNDEYDVMRKKCKSIDCSGNVIGKVSEWPEICLTCGTYQSDEE
jgi:hypothetical protein